MEVSTIKNSPLSSISILKKDEVFDIEFSGYLNIGGKDLNQLIDEVLSSKDTISQEAHKKSITDMKNKGFSEEDLTRLHNILLLIEKNGKENVKLSKEDQELLDEYQNKFDQIQLEMKKVKEKELQFKKEQVKDTVISNLLKIKEQQERE